MTVYREQRRTVVVASAPTAQRAEFIQMTLAAHGISAIVNPSFSMHPSVDFVEGVGVAVAAEDEIAARDVLTAVGLTDDSGSTGTDDSEENGSD